MKNAVSCQQLEMSYPGAKAPTLHGLTLSIAEGEFVCLVGPSGCGKSTVLRLLAGLETPTGGQIRIHGESPPTSSTPLAMVFQSAALFPWRTALENAGFSLAMRGLAREEWESAARQSLALVGLEESAQQMPRELSGGMRQRVGIARALATECQVLLLDEPTSALDPHTGAQLRSDLLKIWQQRRLTVVMVSHSVEETLLMADRVILLRGGVVEQEFTIDATRPRQLSDSKMQRLHQELETALDRDATPAKAPEVN